MFFNMVVADQDEIYISRLTQWFRENRADRFQITAFTEKESLYKFLSETNLNIDVLLVSESFLEQKIPSVVNTVIVLGQPVNNHSENLKYIDKYLPATSLCSEILTLLSDMHRREWNKTENSELIICLSPDQKLKSGLALSLACISPEYIYINFESLPLYYPIMGSYRSHRTLSNILYNIKASKDNLHMTMESAVYTDHNGINFIPHMDNPKDLQELTEEETMILIDALKSWGRFSKVFADIECCAGPQTQHWLKAASVIIVPFAIYQTNQMRRLKKMLYENTDEKNIKWILVGEFESGEIPEDLGSLFFLSELEPLSQKSINGRFAYSQSLADLLYDIQRS